MELTPVEIGRFNRLKVIKQREQGLYLGDDVEEILLPNKYIPENTEIGDILEVFVYIDHEDRPICTTLTPKAQRDEFAYLRVKDVSSIGAFLDWGLEKDLLVPFKEQQTRMQKDQYYLVYLYLDEVTERMVASSQINRWLSRDTEDLEVGQEVEILIGELGELGYTAIIDGMYKGLLYKNEVFKNLKPGDYSRAYIKQIREDQKIDLTLESKTGVANIEPNAQKLLKLLKAHDGFLAIHDKSDLEDVKRIAEMSKKNFKKACGSLYKSRLINIETKGIRLIEK